LQPEPSRSQRKKVATEEDDELDDPPELMPGFMPMIRRVISRFLRPKKRKLIKNRRARGLRALLARLGFRSKFLAAPAPPPAPKPTPPEPPPKPPRGPWRPLRRRFNRPAGP
jgi:hypothetical protein